MNSAVVSSGSPSSQSFSSLSLSFWKIALSGSSAGGSSAGGSSAGGSSAGGSVLSASGSVLRGLQTETVNCKNSCFVMIYNSDYSAVAQIGISVLSFSAFHDITKTLFSFSTL